MTSRLGGSAVGANALAASSHATFFAVRNFRSNRACQGFINFGNEKWVQFPGLPARLRGGSSPRELDRLSSA